MHVMKYLGRDSASAPPGALEQELESLLDTVQPGWKTYVVARRFLPGDDGRARHAVLRATNGLSGRPPVAMPERPNVFLAGDWVGPEGMLADAPRPARPKPPAVRAGESLATPPQSELAPCPHADEVFEEHRPALARLAYRMLGSLADADDVLQEAYLRWARADAWRCRVTARLSPLDRDTALHRRATVGRGSEADLRRSLAARAGRRARRSDPGRRLETAESVSMALLLVLESLSPVERAAYLLRRIFDYDYDMIAQILEQVRAELPADRQSGRAAGSRPSPAVRPRPRQAERLTDAFLEACSTGDLSGLIQILASDAVLYSDGGGKVAAAWLRSAAPTGSPVSSWGSSRKRRRRMEVRRVRVNGQPGAVTIVDGQLDLRTDARRHRRSHRQLLRHPQPR